MDSTIAPIEPTDMVIEPFELVDAPPIAVTASNAAENPQIRSATNPSIFKLIPGAIINALQRVKPIEGSLEGLLRQTVTTDGVDRLEYKHLGVVRVPVKALEVFEWIIVNMVGETPISMKWLANEKLPKRRGGKKSSASMFFKATLSVHHW
jgi:hypothetical protein